MHINRLVRIALATLTILIGSARISAATYFVSVCGNNAWTGLDVNCFAPHGPKRTIQAAINAASNGDMVMVMPGTYFEKIDLDGKAITLISAGGSGMTTIDGNDSGPVVTCNSGETATTVIRGFTVTSGSTTVDGGAMLNVLSSPTVIDCVFSSNHTTGNGAAIACFLAAPTFTDCNIVFNEAGDEPPAPGSGMGAGIYAVSSNITLTDCFMQTCYATRRGALMALINSIATITDCDFYTSGTTFTHGEGGGIFLDQSTVTIDNCLFHGVNAWSPDSQGGSIYAINNSQITCSASNFTSSSAEMRGGAVSLYDSESSFIGCEFNNLDAASGGAMYINGGSLSATLCGFVECESSWSGGGAVYAVEAEVEIGLCTFNDNTGQWHGGAVAGVLSDIALHGCSFSGNSGRSRGGAVDVAHCKLTADSCTFTGNIAVLADSQSHGGGLCITSNGDDRPATVANCTFTGNSAQVGGGLHVAGDDVTVTSCTLQNNIATWLGGGAYLLPLSSSHIIRVNGCQFLENQATQSGGGIEMDGAGRVLVHDTTFTGNAAQSGGGVRCYQNRAVLSSCRFHLNAASEHGAAINALGVPGGVELVNCVVHNNTAPPGGGAISQSGEGFWQGILKIANCTIANNNGGGFYNVEGASTVRNSIIWGNPNGGQFMGVMPIVRYSNVQGGAPGNGNINATPLFQGALGGNYRLLATSPCIDAGNNWGLCADALDLDGDGDTIELVPFDFDGNPRIADTRSIADSGCGAAGIVDMGAFEASGTPVPSLKPGDANGDGVVNVDDLVAVILGWGACDQGCCPCDFNLDGQVDVDDLITVILNWG